MTLTLACWNVNSIRSREAHVVRFLGEAGPDLLLLQELKCTDDQVPLAGIRAAGYVATLHGQKTYNGVAVLSRVAPDAVRAGLPGALGPDGAADVQARWLEVEFGPLVVVCLYLPNGNPIGSDKFTYKIGWMARAAERLAALMASERPVIVAGDFNVIPEAEDTFSTSVYADDALWQPESRAAFRHLLHQGWTDCLRATTLAPREYTFYDYQKGRWERDQGIRIDHILASPEAADRLVGAWIDKGPRSWDKPSDHTPILARFDQPWPVWPTGATAAADAVPL